MRAFNVKTTGKAHFVLGGKISGGGNGTDEVKTSPSTGTLLSADYPKKTGTTVQQNVTYDKKMNFAVNATLDLNEGEFVVISFRNVKSGVEVKTQNVTTSGTVNVSAISEQMQIVPSSKQAGAYIISYLTVNTDQQQDPTTDPSGNPSNSTQTTPTTQGLWPLCSWIVGVIAAQCDNHCIIFTVKTRRREPPVRTCRWV
ncbi:hypothetical protein ANCCAN_26964 [Ancylostoma caninum]|uniref:Uncharacterized protein n=1 Tax=Ancylostoma caninum TaxID=29170 RepID=A0A368F593_ANCCA|nr:hypothetical protein ANCCAN_26964 [Ancylostoma caninum]